MYPSCPLQIAKPEQVVTAEKGVGLPEEIESIMTTYQVTADSVLLPVAWPRVAPTPHTLLVSARRRTPIIPAPRHSHVVITNSGGTQSNTDGSRRLWLSCVLQLAVNVYTPLVRKLLHKYNGYECKEPEPGKFTIAFR